MKRQTFCVTLVSALLAHCSAAALLAASIDVTIVTLYGEDIGEPTDPIETFIEDNFQNVGTITAASYKEGAPTGLGATDLIIISRGTNSSHFDQSNDEVDSWNALPNNMLTLNSYVTRSGAIGKWGWVNNTGNTQIDPTGLETALTPEGQYDPLFDGVLVIDGRADLFNTGITSWVDYDANVGGGTILGTSIGGGQIGIARWSAGNMIAAPRPGAYQTTHGGDRICLGLHGSYFSEYQLDQLTPGGETVLLNALTEFGLTPIPEPSTFAFVAVGSVVMATGVLRRRLWVQRQKTRR